MSKAQSQSDVEPAYSVQERAEAVPIVVSKLRRLAEKMMGHGFRPSMGKLAEELRRQSLPFFRGRIDFHKSIVHVDGEENEVMCRSEVHVNDMDDDTVDFNDIFDDIRRVTNPLVGEGASRRCVPVGTREMLLRIADRLEKMVGSAGLPNDLMLYMPTRWFQDEHGISPERLRSAKKTGRIHTKTISKEGAKRASYHYSVSDAKKLWSDDMIYPHNKPIRPPAPPAKSG